ncbi:MAG TPA: hypothetical protein DCO75_06295 [Fibrobacteres bacterium]|jgi:ABC-2 type transport system ATP-binding protein|nr:hypothetical protein [Fibrobacterota bacterium]
MIFNLNKLFFKYDEKEQPALNNMSLAIDSRLVTGLAGANGSGKTTFIKILLGQLVQFDGSYDVDGEKASDSHGEILYKYDIGYAPDDVVLDEYLTGYEIMEMVAGLRNISGPDLEKDIELFTQSLQLEDWFRQRPCRMYSTGMRRKTALCMAFLGNRKFYVLDEPTNGLDPLSVYGLKTIISEKKSKGAGALISSHILDFVEKTSDDCILLCKGNVSYHGKVAALKLAHDNADLEKIYFSLFSK